MAEKYPQQLDAIKALLTRLELPFIDGQQACNALEHPSRLCHEPRKKTSQFSYFQRLEFLGDHILAFVITEYLYAQYPKATEGELSKRLTFLVRTETLAEIAADNHLEPCILAQKNALSPQGAFPQSVLADSLEVLIALCYTCGGMEKTKALILSLWQPFFDKLSALSNEALKDAKSLLQEYILDQGAELPVYTSHKLSGADHAPTFQAQVVLPDGQAFKAQGPSKRKAEHTAAQLALDAITQLDKEPSHD